MTSTPEPKLDPPITPPDHGTQWDTVLVVALIIVIGVLAAVVVRLVFFGDDFDPISYSPDPRPIERIDDEGVRAVPLVDGFEGPAVEFGDTVPTTGTVCSTAEGDVDVLGNVWWQLPGTSIRIAVVEEFPTTIGPGCRRLAFENDIPEDVEGFVRANGASQWQITGAAVPTRSDGVAATWRTERFWVVPNE